MHLNQFSDSTRAFDMTGTDEFQSLLLSAGDLQIPYALPVSYESRNTVVRRRRLHFLEWGARNATPIVLLHGGRQSAHSWDLTSLSLADRYRVVALDQRGHGDSEWAADGDYSSLAMAEDVLAFVESEGIVKPIIMGHSMGGSVTMHVVRLAPELARAAVFVDIGPEVERSGTEKIGEFIKSTMEFDELDEFIERVHSHDPFRSRDHIERTARYNLLRRHDGKYTSKCDMRRFAGSRGRDPRITLEEVREFNLPALVVRGQHSQVLEHSAAERFVNALPQGALVTVPRCGHNVHSQNTIGFLEAIEPFLERSLGHNR